MEVIFEQVLILMAFAAIGFVLAKVGIVQHEHATVLSKLLVYVFSLCYSVATFARNCTVSYIRENIQLVLWSSVIIVVLAVGMHFAGKLFSKDKRLQSIYEYSLIIPNIGYMGYPFAEALFGAPGLMNVMMFGIPMQIYINTVGYCILSGQKVTLRSLVNPAMAGLVIGGALGISGLGTAVPDVLYTIMDKAGACVGPVSMLLLGIVLSQFGLGAVVREPRNYILTALRLVVIPVAIGGILMLLGYAEVAKVAVLLYAMPCGLNTIVFVQNAGGDCRPGAGMAFWSNILAIGTIPLVLYLFGIRM